MYNLLLTPFGVTRHLRVHAGEKPAECILYEVIYASAACVLLMSLHCRVGLCK